MTEQVKSKRLLNVRLILVVALLPPVAVGLFALAVTLQGISRYDSAYFTGEYVERYSSPGEVARQLEVALQTDDRALLAELQGLHQTTTFATGPDIILVMLWERSDRYSTYVYIDMDTLERHSHHVEQVRGRFVASPTDTHYYLYSGQWLKVAGPVATVWWLAGAVAILAMWVSRLSARLREHMYEEG